MDVAVALPDAYALAEAHTLVVLRKHVSSIYELNQAEQAEVGKFASVYAINCSPKDRRMFFSIGINDGLATGQLLL